MGMLINLIIVVAVLIVIWFLVERFSPDALLTKIAKIVIFVVALVMAVKFLWPLAGL